MKTCLKKVGFLAASIMISSVIPEKAFCATNSHANEDLWSAILIYGVLLIMIVLAIRLMKSANKLKTSAFRNTEKGATWINQKLYDFDADQLEVLINEVNKMQHNNYPKNNEN